MDNNLNQHIDTVYNLQKEYNLSTRSLEYRKKQIQKITTWIESNESRIKTAIKSENNTSVIINAKKFLRPIN